MRLSTQLILIVPWILAFWGCGTPKPIMYYGIQIPAAPAPSTYTYPVQVVVARINGTDLLEASPIVYRTGTNVIGTYQYHRWTEPPCEMVQAKLIRMLRTSGDYQSVSGSGSGSVGDLVVRGRLYEFTETDGEGISGLVSMEFELYNRRTARVLWSHFYSHTEPVETKQIPAVVQALDRNLERGLKEVIAGLGKYFAANTQALADPTSDSLHEAKAK